MPIRHARTLLAVRGLAVRTRLWLAGAVLAGCSASMTDPGREGVAGAPGGGGSGTAGASGQAGVPGVEVLQRSSLRRIAQSEWRHSVHDLFGVATDDVALPSDGRVGVFTSNVGLLPSLLQVDQYAAAAQVVAARVIAGPAQADMVAGCRAAERGDEVCARALIDGVAARAYRRPLGDADREALLAVYRAGRLGRDHAGALALVVEGLLQTPEFLYHVERGVPEGAGARRLTGYEVGVRLASFLWDTLPDESLRAAAASGALDAPEGVEREAARLLAHDRARAGITRFHREWLRLDGLDTLSKDPKRYPFFDDSVRTALGDETDAFSDFVVRRGDGRLSTLLTAPFSFLTGPLFRIYGMVPAVGHDAKTPVGLSPQQRAGLLTQPAVMATHAHSDITSPVHRGLFVFRSLLCQDLPPPPANVNTSPLRPALGSGQTRRQLFAQHEEDPSCGSCHRIIDPIGFAFERYDAMGAYRTTDVDEGGAAIDASASIRTGTDVDGPVTDALALIGKLGRSADVEACYARQWHRFAFGRPDSDDARAAITALQDAFAASGGDIRALLGQVVRSDEFRKRAEVQ